MSLRRTKQLLFCIMVAGVIFFIMLITPMFNATEPNTSHTVVLGAIFLALFLTLGFIWVRLNWFTTRLISLIQSFQQLSTDRYHLELTPDAPIELIEITAHLNAFIENQILPSAELASTVEEDSSAAELQRLVEILESLPDATFAINLEKKVILWNRAMENMTGIKKNDILGKGDYQYSIPFHQNPSPVLIDLIGAKEEDLLLPNELVERKGDTLCCEVYVPSFNDGQGAFLWAKATPLLDAKGNRIGAIETIRDITSRTQAEEQLRYLSMHDPLTSLYNRTFFSQEMDRLSKEKVSPISIIVCDVDGLKLVNDTMGHHAGDSLLVAAAHVLRECLPTNAIISRIGGDEFAIMLPNCSRQTMAEINEQISDGIATYNSTGPEIPLSISVGYASSDKPFDNLSFLFKEADNNMYHEKLHYNQSTQTATVKILMKALETKDFVKEGHVDRLQSLVASVGAALGMSERRINALRLLAKFHDIGKVGIPDRILLKQGPLSPSEVAEIQRHCEIGFRIAQTAPILVPIADGILKHHEWWNGNGYPLGLQGKEIPLDCRLLSIADAYDALTSDRPYRKALSQEKAAAELKRRSGTQFDPELVDIFLNVITKEKGQTKVTVLNN